MEELDITLKAHTDGHVQNSNLLLAWKYHSIDTGKRSKAVVEDEDGSEKDSTETKQNQPSLFRSTAIQLNPKKGGKIIRNFNHLTYLCPTQIFLDLGRV